MFVTTMFEICMLLLLLLPPPPPPCYKVVLYVYLHECEPVSIKNNVLVEIQLQVI